MRQIAPTTLLPALVYSVVSKPLCGTTVLRTLTDSGKSVGYVGKLYKRVFTFVLGVDASSYGEVLLLGRISKAP